MSRDLPPMTPTQQETFTDLLAVGGPRPFAPPDLVAQLRERLTAGTQDATRRWTERTLWVSKSTLFSARRCEAAFVHSRQQPRSFGKIPATAIGDIAHRALQLAYTHPHRPVAEYIRAAVASLRGTDEAFATFFAGLDMATESDVTVQATSRVMSFLDSWPPLLDEWGPRFEEPIQAKVGAVTLSARVDLLLGRPRSTGQQTMFVADWKSGSLREDHQDEAMFHALVAALRYGVAPFRSTVYSLASGTFTDPDVTAERLMRAAEQVVEAVNAMVDVLTEQRSPTFGPGRHCSWCPLRDTCESFQAAQQAAGAAQKPTVLAS